MDSKVKASDEMFFPCCLAILGLIPPERTLQPTQQPSQLIQSSQSSTEQQQELPTNMVLRRQLTYCVWGQVCLSIQQQTHPFTSPRVFPVSYFPTLDRFVLG